MRMMKANFELALHLAIKEAKTRDYLSGIEESIFTAGLKEIKQALERGEKITIE